MLGTKSKRVGEGGFGGGGGGLGGALAYTGDRKVVIFC